MGLDASERLLIGRDAERTRLATNVAKGRHTLLVGPIGIGKSQLLRAVARTLPQALVLDNIRPLRTSLLGLCETLHAQGQLVLPGTTDPSPDWPACARRLTRLTVRELADVVFASLHDREHVLVLDQLEGTTPSVLPTQERLLAETVILGATSQLKPGLQKFWWAFDVIELPPLSREETRQLLWTLADREQVTDPAMFEAKILAQANGNPYAVVELVKQVAGEGPVSRQAIRDLHHGAGVRYLDLTPAVLLVGAGIIIARFVALGLDDRDLYILAGSLGALFVVVRYLLFRSRS